MLGYGLVYVFNFINFVFVFVLREREREPLYVAQAGLKLMIFLLQPLQC
jgi:hypothetical protein